MNNESPPPEFFVDAARQFLGSYAIRSDELSAGLGELLARSYEKGVEDGRAREREGK